MTFQTTDAMIARLDRSASTPSQTTGSAIRPRSSRTALTRPKSVLNSQYQSRLDTPSPMTTGMNSTVRVTRRSGEFGDGQQRQQVAADDQDRRDEERVLEREAERHPELVVGERPGVVVEPDAPRRA